MVYLAKRSISCAELARRSTKILELLFDHLMPCPRNKHIFRCDQNGPPARREEGAYPERYVTDEQRSRRPIFIATLWAAVSWLFFRVARFSRIDLDMLVARALKNSQLTCGERHAYFGDRTSASASRKKPWQSLRNFIPSDS